MPTFDYETINVDNITVNVTPPSNEGKRKPDYTVVLPANLSRGERTLPTTARFWSSMCSRYSTFGVNMNLFSSGMFTPKEVFDRLATKLDATMVRNHVTVVNNDGGSSELLALVALDKPVVRYDDVMNLFVGSKLCADEGAPIYNSGVVCSTHSPRLAEAFEIGEDVFVPRLMFEVPVDGYGKPMVYLSLFHRNSGAHIVGYSPTFKSEINVGKDKNCLFTLTRALESFSNEEGFGALRQRLEAAHASWASIREYMDIYKNLTNLVCHYKISVRPGGSLFTRTAEDGVIGQPGALSDQALLFKAFHNMVGDVSGIYGIVHAEALTRKKMERLPVKCSVWDLVSFLTQVAKFYVDPTAAPVVQRWIGDLIGSANEYDLELSKQTCPTFQDFFAAVSPE